MKNVFGKVIRVGKRMKIYELAAILAVGHSVFSLWTSDKFFLPVGDDELLKRNKLLVEAVFLVVMWAIYMGIIALIKNRKKYKRYIRFGLIYFASLMFILFLIWPGVWRGANDECTIALLAQGYEFWGWHHVLTSLLYMLSFKLIPSFVGIIIVQCALISVVTAYIYTKLTEILKIKKVFAKILLIIPFVLPPVLDSAFYPLRAILWSYALALLLLLMVEGVMTKKVSVVKQAIMVGLLVVVSTWRGEGVYYLLVAIVYFGYIGAKKYIGWRRVMSCLSFLFIGAFMVFALQNSNLTFHDRTAYIVTGMNVPKPLIQKFVDEDDGETMAVLNKIIDPTIVDGYVIDKGFIKGEPYSESDFDSYVEKYISFWLNYPEIMFADRLSIFLRTIYAGNFIDFPVETMIFFEEADTDRYRKIRQRYQEFLGEYPIEYDESFVDEYILEKQRVYDHAREFRESGGWMILPWNQQLRGTILSILEGRSIGDYDKKTIISIALWNLMVPIFCLIMGFVFLCMKKKIIYALIIGTVFVKIIIVFFGAPLTVHMYYFSKYFIGYIMLFAAIAYFLQRKKLDSKIRHR